jgi:N-acetyl-anhydromuramyl-L-alanine amidase AmpD
MRDIKRIIIHMAYTPPSMDIGAKEIREWHVNGNEWSDIGYHKVIRRNGEVEDGRPIEQSGAHTSGNNSDSIGICLVGGKHKRKDTHDCNFTSAQWRTLDRVCRDLLLEFPEAEISGHRDWAARECPGFDAGEWAKTLK